MSLRNSPCPTCRSRGRDRKGDNLVTYEDGGTHCFACGRHTNGPRDNQQLEPATERRSPVAQIQIVNPEFRELPHRRITEDTCRKFRYQVDEEGKEIAWYTLPNGNGAQKVRITKPAKGFSWNPPGVSGYGLFGQNLKDKGPRVYVTEGEIDCMSVWQALGGRDAVVSVPNGAPSAEKFVRQELEFLEGFGEVVFVFDEDDAGRLGVAACVDVITPGKAKVTSLRHKDPNEYLVRGELRALVEDLHNARTYRPKDIIHVGDVQRSDSDGRKVYPYPWDFMDVALLGREQGELIGIFSGTGMGKSTTVREMIHADLHAGHNVGVFMLEESPDQTKDDLIGLDLGKPVSKILRARKIRALKPHLGFATRDDLTEEEYQEAHERLSSLPLYLYDSSEMSTEAILSRMNYLCVGLGCTHIYFDHLTIASAGGDDERKDIDNLMRDLRALAQRTGAVIHVVTQLTDKDGKSYEEGAQISLNKARGSRMIGQTLNTAFGLERNQQADTEEERNTTTVRVLKARGAGRTGVAGHLVYDPATGRQTDPKARPTLRGATLSV